MNKQNHCNKKGISDNIVKTPYSFFPVSYEKALLSDLCLQNGGIQTGPFGSQLHKRDYVANGTPIITVEHLGKNRIIHRDMPMISERDRQRLSRFSLETGDIVFSRVGSVDLCALVREEESGWLFSGRCLRIRTNPEIIDPAWLSWFFNLPTFRDYIRKIAVGATMPSLNTKILSDLIIFYPPIKEQKAIAHILGTLDDKIEANSKMNETLERMAQGIFKSWFVDFDPVRAKVEGRDTGLPKHIADLFPCSLANSDLGEIPKGWKIMPIGEAVKAVGGGTPSTKNLEYWNCGSYNWATPKDLSNISAPILLESERKITEKGLNQISSGLLPPGTVLMSSRAPVGYLAISAIPIAINQGFIAMLCEGPVSNYYILNWCYYRMDDIQQRAIGTTFPEISKAAFRPLLMIAPKQEVMNCFTNVVKPFYDEIQNNLTESKGLSIIRDALLPKLMSGEIRVREAENIIGRIL